MHSASDLARRSLLTCLCLIGVLSTSSSSEIALPSESSNKVSLGLYYESLCPYSADFVVNHLPKIFDSDLVSHVDLHLVPWGNAKMRGNATFDCQHGPWECLLNTVEACAIDVWPDLSEHFPLIYCIEKLVYSHDYAQWESCFEPLGLDSKLVSDCYAGGRGKELELEYAAETNALQPPHQYVPWVVVDGKPLYDDYVNFMSYICEAYSGTAKPEACSKLSLNRVQLREARKSLPVCYLKEKMSSPAFKVVRSAVESMMGWTKMLLDA
ncbi:gamma-interferon-responsive lysosomal thiol protein isoform X2 [Eucalyptus grandis]|uniref:Uncharacterized protein n=2 Tax=Eucalyptus grandis TaxID=71139 RepID=A0ACC3LST0_EUCGR|nr:gamma-interferon-responsive lysosomal thiol protein isoform X2 [Eucalyptus grandis]KAK3441966.1 hypothetical protein EUGRSUZ_B02223 [Eucalyptus grandis]